VRSGRACWPARRPTCCGACAGDARHSLAGRCIVSVGIHKAGLHAAVVKTARPAVQRFSAVARDPEVGHFQRDDG
jgi:hypothetical protein